MRIVGWERFQGYKKRGPEWIKLHLSLLDQPQYLGLPLVARAVMPALWLTAARTSEDGSLPDDIALLSVLSHVRESELREALPHLSRSGFVDCDGLVASSATEMAGEKRESRGEQRERQNGGSVSRDEPAAGNGNGATRLSGDQREEYGWTVWEAFQKRAGRERQCSSAEWALILRWLEKSWPLAVVLRGIAETGGTPRNLWACEAAVQRAVEYQARAVPT